MSLRAVEPLPTPSGVGVSAQTRLMPRIQVTPQTEAWSSVGKPEKKVDAVKLVQGKPAFTADFEKPGLLYAKVLHSPLAHARIKHIDASQARAAARCGGSADLAGYPACGLFHRRAVRSHPRPAGYFLAG